MFDINDAKSQLLGDLWLPVIKRGGDTLYPRLRKNKKMRVLTLTTDSNFEEIVVLVDEKLTQRERIIAWTYSIFKKFRLETDIAPSTVLGPNRYEDVILNGTSSLISLFPFDVINLDFSSQEPLLEKGRIEREIISVEETIRLQKRKNNFVLIYTTILNSNQLDLMLICALSNSKRVHGWKSLDIDDYRPKIPESSKKIDCVRDILGKISLKYDYVSEFDEKSLDLTDKKVILSLAGLLAEGG
jgi:hypothetical protein